MKKNAKKDDTSNNDMISEIKEEFKRHTTALMEHVTKEVKVVAEGHGILVKKIDKIKSDIGELKEDMAIVKPVVERNSKDIQELKTDVQEVKKDIREVKSELHSMNMAIMETSHETKDHEKRIKKIEEKVFV